MEVIDFPSLMLTTINYQLSTPSSSPPSNSIGLAPLGFSTDALPTGQPIIEIKIDKDKRTLHVIDQEQKLPSIIMVTPQQPFIAPQPNEARTVTKYLKLFFMFIYF